MNQQTEVQQYHNIKKEEGKEEKKRKEKKRKNWGKGLGCVRWGLSKGEVWVVGGAYA